MLNSNRKLRFELKLNSNRKKGFELTNIHAFHDYFWVIYFARSHEKFSSNWLKILNSSIHNEKLSHFKVTTKNSIVN